MNSRRQTQVVKNGAEREAAEILRRYRLRAPVDVSRIVEAEGLEIVPWDFAGRVHETIVGTSIGISSQILDPRYRRERIAHALGHHFLHAGNQLLERGIMNDHLTRREETEATAFAMALLVPADELFQCLAMGMDVSELADHFGVTESFVRARCRVLEGLRHVT